MSPEKSYGGKELFAINLSAGWTGCKKRALEVTVSNL